MIKSVKKFFAPLRIVKNKVFLLVFLNGFLLALLIYFYTEDNYEKQLFKALGTLVRKNTTSTNTDSLLVQSLHLTYALEQSRQNIFKGSEISSIKSEVIRPVTFDLMTGVGACGSYSFVLARLLNELNIETRFAQMKVGNDFGGHIIIEAFSNGRWVVMDASYDLMFKTEDGHFADFKEVHGNWQAYQQQVPANYDMTYSYDAVRYTNWEKIPVVLPALKKVIAVAKGQQVADEFSLRNLVIRKFNLLFKITFGVYLLACFFLVRTYKRQAIEIENFRMSLHFAKKSMKMQAAAV